MSDTNNVIPLKLKQAKVEKKDEPTETNVEFDLIVEKNKQNEERLKRERAQANKSVLRSYRIKS